MQHIEPVEAAARYMASVSVTHEQREEATDRAIESVMSDMDTLHEWLYRQVYGVTVCSPYRLASMVRLEDASLAELPTDELLALLWNADAGSAVKARDEIAARYQAYRKADIDALANKMLVEVEV